MDPESHQITAVDLGYYENEKQIDVLVYDHDDHFELKTTIDGIDLEAQADDLFSAFQTLRDKLLGSGYGIKCNGAKINALQSGMMRNTDAVYLVELGRRAEKKDVHGLWDLCEMEGYANTEEQERFAQEWRNSLIK